MNIEKKLKSLFHKGSDIGIVSVENNSVEVLVPYESGSVIIEIEGDTEEELIESFKEGLNRQLDTMIDHLNDCKLD